MLEELERINNLLPEKYRIDLNVPDDIEWFMNKQIELERAQVKYRNDYVKKFRVY